MFSPILLTGLTGSGKTALLQYLPLRGEQIIDLENLAQHNGSLFGSINRTPISSQNYFEQILWHSFQQIDDKRPVFTEFKGKTLGTLKIPTWFLDFQQLGFQIFIDTSYDLRLQHLLHEYQHISIEQFGETFKQMKNRLSKQQQEEAILALEMRSREKFIKAMMHYFDNSPRYKNLKSEANFCIKTDEKFEVERIFEEVMSSSTSLRQR